MAEDLKDDFIIWIRKQKKINRETILNQYNKLVYIIKEIFD